MIDDCSSKCEVLRRFRQGSTCLYFKLHLLGIRRCHVLAESHATVFGGNYCEILNKLENQGMYAKGNDSH